MTDTTIDTLNEFLRGECAAVETYELAIKSTTDVQLGTSLQNLWDDHSQRVTLLRQKIISLGGTPSDSSGAWGAFAKTVQAGADLLGDTASMTVLEEGEDRGIKMYSEAIKNPDPVIVDLVSQVLMPAQRTTHDLCRSLKRFVKAA